VDKANSEYPTWGGTTCLDSWILVYILFIFCISDYIVVPLYLIDLTVYLVCTFMYLMYML
jgi:hypothetical protein